MKSISSFSTNSVQTKNLIFSECVYFRRADPDKPVDTYVNIEFLTWPIIRYKREVLFGWVDLLVSFGGIAGLFLGFSLLSGVETIYYFTLRAWCMLHKNRVSEDIKSRTLRYIIIFNYLTSFIFRVSRKICTKSN